MTKHQFDKLYEKYIINPYNLNSKKELIIEHGLFDIGTSSTKSATNFESNKKVNNELLDKSTSKLFSNITSKVMQTNSADAAAAVGSTNTIWLNGVKCKNIVISGVDQTSTSKATVTSNSKQDSTTNVSSEITNSISKKMSSSGDINFNDIDKYEAPNIQKLKTYMSGNPLFNLANALAFGSINPKETITIDNSMKSALNLDQSFSIKPTQEITTNIGNSISQANLATCKASANSQNQLLLSDIECNNFKMDNIKQKAFSELIMNCVFDQKNTSNITTKITNELKSQYNQVYQSTDKKPCPETKSEDKSSVCSNPELLDTWVGATIEKLALVAGVLPEAKPKPIPIVPEEEIKPEVKPEALPPTPPPEAPPTPPESTGLTQNQLLLIGGIGFVVLLLIMRR